MNPHLPYRIHSDVPVNEPRSTHVRESNVRDLLRLLRRHSPCSRADLVRFSGLTAPTVSAGISSLQRRDLVTTLGNTSSNVGRPAGLLEFNARHGYVVGVDIGAAHVRIAVADLNGTVIGRWNSVSRADRSPKVVIELIAGGVTRICQQQKVPLKKVLQIAVGSPGITDVAAGRVLSAHSLTDWNDVPLRDLLQDKLRIATVVENDVNLGALGEGWCGAARNVANFIFLSVGSGVGAGVVVNGILHHGANWSAGEIGYMMLPGLAADPPAIGIPGPFESVVGGQHIERAWREEPGSDSAGALRATDIFDLAATGDNKGREVLHRIADYLAMAITNVCLVLDLSLVVLGGGVGHHAGLLRAIERRLERNQFGRPQLVIGSLSEEARSYGAIWLALQASEAQGFRSHVVKSEAKAAHSVAGVP
jgi:glucokinase